jgi:aryl-alcohol dehydrogenase-like predicted oxidoreductase
MMEKRTLGGSELEVSRLSLGSWRTFERLPRDDALAVMGAARELGFNFLDDARYDDETGGAPIPTGYSEVLFGELFRAVGWDRDATVVSNKLWWEFWPRDSAAAELDGSLSRMGFDYVDLIYANPPPDGLAIDELVAAMGDLVSSGKARAWGIVNWEAEPLMDAIRSAARQGAQQPCAVQLPYSLVAREFVESIEMRAALEASGADVVASFVMAGGILTGKYDAGGSGRADAEIEGPRFAAAREYGRRLRALAPEIGCSPAALAIAFALANPAVATVLFGATSPEQLAEDVTALEVSPAAVQSLLEEGLSDCYAAGRASQRSIKNRAIETPGGSSSSGFRPCTAASTSARVNQPTASSSPSCARGSPPSERASKPSISELGNGHGCDWTNFGSRATIPDSSATSRTTASSAASPADTKPASTE